MTGQVFINGLDAYSTWGVTFAHGALDALMTPAPAKDAVTSGYRGEHGVRWVNGSPYMDERTVSLEMHIHGSSFDALHTLYQAFCSDVLEGQAVDIVTKYQPTVCYKMRYVSCTSFSHVQGLAKFTLKLSEPNPSDRENTYEIDW